MSPAFPPTPKSSGTSALVERALRAYHRYGVWLVSISWGRFFLLSLLLMIGTSILQNLPPFRWRVTETIERDAPSARAPAPPRPPEPPAVPGKRRSGDSPASASEGPLEISISVDKNQVRIQRRSPVAAGDASSSSASAPEPASAASAPAGPAWRDSRDIVVKLPAGTSSETVREIVQEAEDAIRDVLDEADGRNADDAVVRSGDGGPVHRVRVVRWGDFLTQLALLWIIASMAIKASYKGQLKAEKVAARATETAEAESLKRQVVEARMAAMQAQVEPHFLFNTLASIDHLIETDPARASTMQKNLIALLRASMPTMREAQDSGAPRDLKRELAVIRPYLEILKVRMEDRLATRIDVPDGLLSAEFPPMMIQSLVENAIKHGLEPKPEGGTLTVSAQIEHGRLALSVADSGLGFAPGASATAGTGVGLANIRERLQMLYGANGSLVIAPNPGGGTVATITIPYRSLESSSTPPEPSA